MSSVFIAEMAIQKCLLKIQVESLLLFTILRWKKIMNPLVSVNYVNSLEAAMPTGRCHLHGR